MSPFSSRSVGGLLAFFCAVFLAIIGLYITWIVPLRVVRLLSELRDEARAQTALLRQLAGQRGGDRGSTAVVSEPDADPIHIPGIN